MDNGWIKDYRKVEDNPIVTKDNDYFRIWYYLLHEATHENIDVLFNGKRIKLKPGQLTAGRNQIALKCNCNASKVQRILKTFEIEHQIEQQTSNKCRLITIVNWNIYQKNEQQNEHQVNIKRTTSEQQVNTKQECKNVKNDKNIKEKINKKEKFKKPTLDEVREYIKEKNFNVSPEAFIDYYESNGWKVGKNSMKNWKSTINGWNRREVKPNTYNSRETLSEKLKRLKKEAEEYDRREALTNDKN